MFAHMRANMRSQLKPESVRQYHRRSASYGAGVAGLALAGIAAKRLGFIPPALIRETGTIYNKFDPRRRFYIFNSERPLWAHEEKLAGIPFIGKKFRTAISSIHDEPGAEKLAYTVPRTTQSYHQRLDRFRSRMSDWVTNNLDPLNVLGRQKVRIFDEETQKYKWQPKVSRVVLGLEKLEQKTEDFGRNLVTKLKKRFLDPTITRRQLKRALDAYRKTNKETLDLNKATLAAELRDPSKMGERTLSEIAASMGIKNRAVIAAHKALRRFNIATKKNQAKLANARQVLEEANAKLSRIKLRGVVDPAEQKRFRIAKRARLRAFRDWKRAIRKGDRQVKKAFEDAQAKELHAKSIDLADLIAEQSIEKNVRADVMAELSTKYTSPAQRLANRIVDPLAKRIEGANEWLHKKALRFGRWLKLPGMTRKRAR